MRIGLDLIEKVNGVILYDGPSLLNKKPIVCIATGLLNGSTNSKTGDFIQTYILANNNKLPTANLVSGGDEASCGDCIHRKIDGLGTCYVNVAFGPDGVYKAFKNNKYAKFENKHLELFKDKLLRCGAYGDPAALPVSVWEKIISVTKGHTGYTHQWKKCDQKLKEFCMASVDNPKELKQAKQMGWKTFRVRRSDEPILPGEFACPASIEQNKRLKCEDCLACCGTKGYNNGKSVTPTIISHGLDWKSKRFNLGSKLREQKKKFRGLNASKN